MKIHLPRSLKPGLSLRHDGNLLRSLSFDSFVLQATGAAACSVIWVVAWAARCRACTDNVHDGKQYDHHGGDDGLHGAG